MGNPIVTRLGITQFWYKNWHNNFHFSKTFKIMCTLEKIVNTYFNYGIFYQNNFFHHSFWYKNLLLKQNILEKNIFKKNLYFRKYFFSHQTLTIEHSYYIRLKTPEYFPLKLYIMKYRNWVIASLQWFKPLKKSNKILYNPNQNTLTFYTKKSPSILKLRKRLVLISLYLSKFNKLANNNAYYKF